jgi:hypothetical protein
MSTHGWAGLAPFNGGEGSATEARIGRRWVGWSFREWVLVVDGGIHRLAFRLGHGLTSSIKCESWVSNVMTSSTQNRRRGSGGICGGYIEARDGARAVRLALKSDLTATEVFIIASAETVMSRPNAALIAKFYPVVEVRDDLGEHDTVLSIDKARRLLGCEPA